MSDCYFTTSVAVSHTEIYLRHGLIWIWMRHWKSPTQITSYLIGKTDEVIWSPHQPKWHRW